jgi:GH35 family endo-1,4-beta-xylanase
MELLELRHLNAIEKSLAMNRPPAIYLWTEECFMCRILIFSVVILALGGSPGWAITGNGLIMKSNGSNAGSDWVLADTGYVGTYITLASPGSVTINVEAQGTASSDINPHMNIVINDESMGWSVPTGFTNYQHTFNLPAGTHFVRTEFANDSEKSARQLQIRNLNVTGATLANTNSDANALAASNTYISSYRKGNVSVALPGLTPGTSVDVKLKNHAFNFGTAVAGFNESTIMDPNPTPGSNAHTYQEKLKTHFNALVPENAGKWQQNEFAQDSVWHPQLDKIVNFANDNGKRLRMHNLIWDNQQPNWVNTLLNQASGNQAARDALREEISERIDYYVGDGDTDYDDGDFAQNYYEIDVYNEMVHTPKYWNAYTASGIADIYNEVAAAAGPNVGVATNEYNVFQDSGDFYGKWYKDSIEQIVAAGGAVSAIGIQSYENNWAPGDSCWCSHYPVRKMQTLQNLSVLGMPITLTEFGVKSGTSPERTSIILQDTMRLMFGSPNATGFYMWGFWNGDIWSQAPAAAFFDTDWNLTMAGQTWLDLMEEWNTDLTAIVGGDGTINFDGFWGDYELTINGETYGIALNQGTFEYLLAIETGVTGDYNGDGKVSAADYTVWRDTYGSTTDLRANGDDSNSVIDDDDYQVWLDNFGMVQASGSGASATSAAVPEPATAVLLLMAALAWRCSAARRR